MTARLIRAVFDTNVFISAILFAGLPETIMQLGLTGKFRLVTSPILIEELLDKLRTKFRQDESDLMKILNQLEKLCEVVSTTESLRVVQRDADDDRVLECAVAGRADYIVTGDRHLLDLHEFRAIPILTVRQFLDHLQPPA